MLGIYDVDVAKETIFEIPQLYMSGRLQRSNTNKMVETIALSIVNSLVIMLFSSLSYPTLDDGINNGVFIWYTRFLESCVQYAVSMSLHRTHFQQERDIRYVVGIRAHVSLSRYHKDQHSNTTLEHRYAHFTVSAVSLFLVVRWCDLFGHGRSRDLLLLRSDASDGSTHLLDQCTWYGWYRCIV